MSKRRTTQQARARYDRLTSLTTTLLIATMILAVVTFIFMQRHDDASGTISSVTTAGAIFGLIATVVASIIRLITKRRDRDLLSGTDTLEGDIMSDTLDSTDPETELVLIIHLSGDDYEEAVDQANEEGGSVQAVAEYLAQWDYGEDTDSDTEMLGGSYRPRLQELLNLPHQLHEVLLDGRSYWVQIDHGLRFYSLYRKPLDGTDV